MMYRSWGALFSSLSQLALPLQAQFPLSSVYGSERSTASTTLWPESNSFIAQPNPHPNPS